MSQEVMTEYETQSSRALALYVLLTRPMGYCNLSRNRLPYSQHRAEKCALNCDGGIWSLANVAGKEKSDKLTFNDKTLW